MLLPRSTSPKRGHCVVLRKHQTVATASGGCGATRGRCRPRSRWRVHRRRTALAVAWWRWYAVRMESAPAITEPVARLDAELCAYAGLTAASLGWASAYVAGKLALAEMTPLAVATWRCA